MTTQVFTILHVEDDPNDVLLVERAMKKSNAGAMLKSVSDGDKAVSYLKGDDVFSDRDKNPIPDLVLLDLKMPRKSGMEVLTWIRAQDQFKRLPVVIFTSSKHEQDITRAYDLGANSYLVKPVGFDSLLDTLKQVYLYWGNLNQRPGRP
jgi:DNA-binding response OmpR family regulator